MSIHGKWKYFYWFAAFSFFGIVIEILYIFSGGTAAMVLAGLCISTVSTCIYKKIPWMIHNTVRIKPDNTDSQGKQ